jgi:aminoglycoside phosphotransferase (APT) family kinase protein
MTKVEPFAVLAALGVGDAEAVTPVTTGIGGANIYRVERRGEIFALRVYRVHAIEPANREQAAMETARAAGVPVPRVRAQAEWAERPVVLLEWSPGRPMLDALRRRPWLAFAYGRRLGRVQAAIHAAPVPDGGPVSSRDWLSWNGIGETPLGERLAAVQQDRALLHLDLHPLNVLVDGNRISAVLDWENAAVGDPRADLARTWSLLRLSPAPPGPANLLVTPVRRVLEAGWRRGYREMAGWPPDLAAFKAWAAEAMARDLGAKVGREGVWFGVEQIEALRREAERWGRRAESLRD